MPGVGRKQDVTKMLGPAAINRAVPASDHCSAIKRCVLLLLLGFGLEQERGGSGSGSCFRQLPVHLGRLGKALQLVSE